VVNFGAGDLIEIAVEGARETQLLPFTKACVPEIDLAAGRILVVPPPESRRRAEPCGGLRCSRCFPKCFQAARLSLSGEALSRGLWSIEAKNVREHGLGRHRNVDDTPAVVAQAW